MSSISSLKLKLDGFWRAVTGTPEHFILRARIFHSVCFIVALALLYNIPLNFAIDLPDANVLIQVSGMFGSRQEEAQRLGRVLRPKTNGLLAHFYSIVTRDTLDQEFAAKRQLFLTEQGYHYEILYEDEVAGYQPAVLATTASPVRRTVAGYLN